MRHVRVLCFLLSQDFPLGLEPIFMGALADASLVDLVGSLGDPFVEILRRRRWLRTLFGAARGSLVYRLRFVRFMSPIQWYRP